MRRSRAVSWGMLAVWGSWLTALQAAAVSGTALGSATPDLSLVLLLGCSTRLHRRDVVPAALVVALGRIAYSVDPPAAVLAAYLSVAVAVRSARRVADVDRPAFRVLLGGLLALAVSAWLTLVHDLRSGSGTATAVAPLLPGAVATAVACVAAGGFVMLPGLTPLRRRRW